MHRSRGILFIWLSTPVIQLKYTDISIYEYLQLAAHMHDMYYTYYELHIHTLRNTIHAHVRRH